MAKDLKVDAHEEFSQWAKTYDSSLLNFFLFNPAHSMILSEFAPPEGSLVLDIGCGTGKLLQKLALRGCNVTGLDLCEEMVLVAQAKAERAGAKGQFVVGDSEALPFGDHAFDFVTCSNSFHHYPNQEGAIAEMFRVLKNGGRLILLDGCRDNWLGRLIYDFIITRVEGEVRHVPALAMRHLLRQAGFREVVQLQRSHFFPILLTSGIAEKNGQSDKKEGEQGPGPPEAGNV
ncbi:MAG: class I SAM-dependent methyltransferase [Planctomycetia bacterium]|nr:class I SAM-dependent methyltransferase [Planctomycetia bacterium]